MANARLLLAGLVLLTALFGAPLPGTAQQRATLEDGGAARVVSVVDGDTVILDDGRQVRLVGILAPKLPLGRPGFVKWPLADAAKARLEELVLGRRVACATSRSCADGHS